METIFTSSYYEQKEKLFLLALAAFYNATTQESACSYNAINEYSDLTFAEIGQIREQLADRGEISWDTIYPNHIDVYNVYKFEGNLKELVFNL